MIDRAAPRKEEARRAMLGYGDFDTTMNVVAKAVAKGPWLMGEQFTAADVVIGSNIRWGTMFKLIPERRNSPTTPRASPRGRRRSAPRRRTRNSRRRDASSPLPACGKRSTCERIARASRVRARGRALSISKGSLIRLAPPLATFSPHAGRRQSATFRTLRGNCPRNSLRRGRVLASGRGIGLYARPF